MDTGKECSRAECARLRSRLHCVTTRRVASTRQGVRRAPPFDFRHRQAAPHCVPKWHWKIVVSGKRLWHCVLVKTILSKPASSATAADVEVRQLRATGKRIAANKKLGLRFLAATGMYTLKGQLKPQFR